MGQQKMPEISMVQGSHFLPLHGPYAVMRFPENRIRSICPVISGWWKSAEPLSGGSD
jgi:hypothetical protein